MEFHFDSSEKKTYITVNTSEKYFYELETSCSVIFLHTDGKIFMDVEDKTVKNFLESLVSKKNPISKPVIGNSFAVDITGEKIGIAKLVFFYIDGSIDKNEKGLIYENYSEDEKSKLREEIKQTFDGANYTKQQLDDFGRHLLDLDRLAKGKVNMDFINVLNNNTNGSLSIQHPTLSPGFSDPVGIYNVIIEKLLLDTQWHNITSVDLCCGDEWRRYVETNEFLQEVAFCGDYDDYDVLEWGDSYLGYAVQTENLQAEIRYKDNLIEKLGNEKKESHYPIDYTNQIIESDIEPTKVIWSLISSLEIVSKYMGQIFLADYIKSGKEDEKLNKKINNILKNGHLTIGTWAKVCMMISGSYEKEYSRPYLLVELAALIPSKEFQDLYRKIQEKRNAAVHSLNSNLEGKIDSGDYRENLISFINMIKSALVKTKLIYINEKASIENDGKTYETKYQILEGLYPRKAVIKTNQHLLHEQLYITDESKEKFVGLHPFMKYEFLSKSKKGEFYTVKQIIELTFVYNGIQDLGFGEGKEQEIDIDSII